MPILHASLQGRFGNQCMQVLFARSIAERCGAEFRCDDWMGNKIFSSQAPTYEVAPKHRVNETELLQWSYLQPDARGDIEFRGYAQMQSCLTYTKQQAQEWFTIRPEIKQVLDRILANRTPIIMDSIVAHRRVGDYFGYGYPVIGEESYRKAARHYFGSDNRLVFAMEEKPVDHSPLSDELAFLPDFYRMMQAPVLMRGNSTFSFMAGLLGNGLVLSPRINGLAGGVEHNNVRFEAGNHCKLADFDFCSDLYVSP